MCRKSAGSLAVTKSSNFVKGTKTSCVREHNGQILVKFDHIIWSNAAGHFPITLVVKFWSNIEGFVLANVGMV
jgi:hypothetical protein